MIINTLTKILIHEKIFLERFLKKTLQELFRCLQTLQCEIPTQWYWQIIKKVFKTKF